MKILLDTHLLLWVYDYPKRLSKNAISLIEDDRNEIFFSPVSLWEVAIKSSLGKADFQVDAPALYHALLHNDYVELPITGAHTIAVNSLPPIHKDPFDRLLIAQAMVEHVTLLTADRTISRYPGLIRKI